MKGLPSEVITPGLKTGNPNLLSKSPQKSFLSFQRLHLHNPRFFRFLTVLFYQEKRSCLTKALEPCKVGSSTVIVAGLKILKSNYALEITSNMIIRLREDSSTQSLYFSIF